MPGLCSDMFFSPKREGRVPCLGVGAVSSGLRSLGASKPGSLDFGALFVRPQEAGNFGAEQLDERFWQHLLVFLCVLEVVLGVGQHLKEGLDELLVLQRMAGSNVSLGISSGTEAHGFYSAAPLDV